MTAFYTQLFTSKRGSMAKIWLAAHWERKITKAHVFECNLESTIKDIICPQINIGLRTSGHLLLGVVRIYSRKAKYLLADCSDAVVQIKVSFRPGQTDLPVEGLEATLKAITLMENFPDFESQLPDLNTIDDVDHFSLNQSRTEEITLKEDYGNAFHTFKDIAEGQDHGGIMDMSFQSLTHHGDGFGDENKGFDILDFMSNSSEHTLLTGILPYEPQNERPETPPIAVNHKDVNSTEAMEEDPPILDETPLLVNEVSAFDLEPVDVTPSSEKKRGKRKRRLVVDGTKELSNNAIREQLTDWPDLEVAMDIAPPTRQLMQWKESGGVDTLFIQLCGVIIHPQLLQLYTKNVFRGKAHTAASEVDQEVMREDRHLDQREIGDVPSVNISVLQESVGPEAVRRNVELTPLHHMTDNSSEHCWDTANNGSRLEVSHPDLPSEDSMLVHHSGFQGQTQFSVIRTQSMLDSQDFEEMRMTNRAQNLLNALQSSSSSNAMFSLLTLCEGSNRSQAAATFFCLLVLKKQQALCLHQNGPYTDVTVTAGPRFHLS
ncbi:double-strand-break repair protein rad21-like protein 1 [Osmerus mordax]|uniref:double-strand-break repair protein rad21-like protein 1 n=1 Tax=Osmerus mordax TaxID=8014 RepID=UPI00350EF5CF